MNARAILRHGRAGLLAGLALAIFVLAGTAAAFWTAGGAGAGTGGVGTLHAPTAVAATTGSGSAHVSWSASPAAGGLVPTGYYVRRWSGGLPAVAGGDCGAPASPLSQTSCDETGIADGTYTYTVVAVYRSWTAESSHSSPVTVINDVTAPSSSITFPSTGARLNASGWGAGCSSAGICGSASDSGAGATGVSQVQVSVQRSSDSRYWSSASSSWVVAQTWNAASGTTAWTLALAAANLTDAVTYTVQSRAIDGAANIQPAPASSSFTYDTSAPTVTAVSSTLGNGSYKADTVVPVTVSFSEAVTVTGSPQLTLALSPNRAVSYSSGSGTTTLTFNLTVAAGDTSADLDYAATTSLALNGGTIRDAAANSATLTLPAPAAAGSLGANRNIVIDTTAPALTLTRVNGTLRTFPYTTNANVTSLGGACGTASGDAGTVSVTVNGSATSPATASCSAGSWTLTLTTPISAAGTYAIVASQSDTATNAGSTAQTIVIDKTAPTITAVSSQQSGGAAGNGKLEVGDSLILTVSENLAALPATFTGATESRSGSNNVRLTIPNVVANSDTGSSGYLAGGGTKTATFSGTLALSNNGAVTIVTITVTALSGDATGTSTGVLALVPGTAIVDLAGNGASATFTTASGFKLF